MYKHSAPESAALIDAATIKIPLYDELQVVSGSTLISVKLKSGAAEVRGEPLAPSETYLLLPYSTVTLAGGFPAGCELAVAGTPEHARVLSKPNHTRNLQLVNLCEKLNSHRACAYKQGQLGPVVVICGTNSLCEARDPSHTCAAAEIPEKAVMSAAKILRNYSYRSGWLPPLLNLDRTGCHSDIEFLQQGPHTLQAHLPDIASEESLELAKLLETSASSERLGHLADLPANSAETRAPRDGEHARARAISILSSLGRREAANGLPVSALTDERSDGRLIEGISLSPWEVIARPLNDNGDIVVGCYCPQVSHDCSCVPPPPPPSEARQPPSEAVRCMKHAVPHTCADCSCHAANRLLDLLDTYMERKPRARAAGAILVVGDVGVSFLSELKKLDCVVLCNTDPPPACVPVIDPVSALHRRLGSATVPVTLLPHANEGPYVPDRLFIRQQRMRQVFCNLDPALVLPKLVRGRVQSYLVEAKDTFPLNSVNDLLPSRLLLSPLPLHKYIPCDLQLFDKIIASHTKEAITDLIAFAHRRSAPLGSPPTAPGNPLLAANSAPVDVAVPASTTAAAAEGVPISVGALATGSENQLDVILAGFVPHTGESTILSSAFVHDGKVFCRQAVDSGSSLILISSHAP